MTIPGTTTKIRYGSTLPATCEPGDVFFKTGTNAGLYDCSATNTWRQLAPPVASVFGRTGTVAATSGDYSEAQISFTDITTNNASTSKHGYLPKLPNDATKFIDGTGAWSVPSSGRGSSGGKGGFSLTNLSVSSDAAPHLRAGSSGTLDKVTVVLRRLVTTTLTMTLYLDGVAACTINVPSSTAVDSIVAVTSFSSSTVTDDSIFKLAITASDSSVDPQGVATVQMFWS
jgi:hypothetical protein